MQEKEILSFLCRSNEIRNSFEFVRLFYEEMSRQQQQGDLDELPDEPIFKSKAKVTASLIVTNLEKECQKEGFKFPKIRHFMLRDNELEQKPLSVFQSSVQIVPRPFYIKEHKTRWEIVKSASEETLLAQRLLSIINRTTDSILNFFSEVWADGLKPEWEAWFNNAMIRRMTIPQVDIKKSSTSGSLGMELAMKGGKKPLQKRQGSGDDRT